MNNRTSALLRVRYADTLLFAGLLISIVFIPMIRVQLVSGSLVNAALIVAAIVLGSRAGYALAVVPSLVAVTSGLLPAAAVPFIPFIMASNIILVAVVSVVNKKSKYIFAVGSAAIAKTVFLVVTGALIVSLLQSPTGAQIVSTMFGWIQLVTALIGGLLAYSAIRLFQKE